LTIPAEHKAEAERALEFHPTACPAYQTVKDAIRFKIEARLDFE